MRSFSSMKHCLKCLRLSPPPPSTCVSSSSGPHPVLPLCKPSPSVPCRNPWPHPLHSHSSDLCFYGAVTFSQLASKHLEGNRPLTSIFASLPRAYHSAWPTASMQYIKPSVTQGRLLSGHKWKKPEFCSCSTFINQVLPPAFHLQTRWGKAELTSSHCWDQDPKHMSAHMEGPMPGARRKTKVPQGKTKTKKKWGKEEKTSSVKDGYCSQSTAGTPVPTPW